MAGVALTGLESTLSPPKCLRISLTAIVRAAKPMGERTESRSREPVT
jgi:hypothetical protein